MAPAKKKAAKKKAPAAKKKAAKKAPAAKVKADGDGDDRGATFSRGTRRKDRTSIQPTRGAARRARADGSCGGIVGPFRGSKAARLVGLLIAVLALASCTSFVSDDTNVHPGAIVVKLVGPPAAGPNGELVDSATALPDGPVTFNVDVTIHNGGRSASTVESALEAIANLQKDSTADLTGGGAKVEKGGGGG